MLYHTSPEIITEIKEDGLFADGLFFSAKEYAMGDVKVVYAIDESKLKIANVWDLDEASITISDFASIFNIDEDLATDILIGKDFIASYTEDYEDEWTTQKFQLEAAKELGFDGVELEDEQGASWLISMRNNFHLLNSL